CRMRNLRPGLQRAPSRLFRRAPDFFQARVAAAAEAVELVADRILLVVVLVVILGRVEHGRRDDLGRNRPVEAAGRLPLLLARLGQAALLVVDREDRAAVLRAGIAELPI